MLDLINSTEEEVLEAMNKAMKTGPIATQDKVDYYADELVKIIKEINEKTSVPEDTYSSEETETIILKKKIK